MDRGGSGSRSRTTTGAKRIIALLEDNSFSDLKQYGAPVGYITLDGLTRKTYNMP